MAVEAAGSFFDNLKPPPGAGAPGGQRPRAALLLGRAEEVATARCRTGVCRSSAAGKEAMNFLDRAPRLLPGYFKRTGVRLPGRQRMVQSGTKVVQSGTKVVQNGTKWHPSLIHAIHTLRSVNPRFSPSFRGAIHIVWLKYSVLIVWKERPRNSKTRKLTPSEPIAEPRHDLVSCSNCPCVQSIA
jgi:hypothetical protein